MKRVTRMERMERMERRLPGMVLPLETPRYCRHTGHQTPSWSPPTAPRDDQDHAAQTAQHSTVHNTQTQRVMSLVSCKP